MNSCSGTNPFFLSFEKRYIPTWDKWQRGIYSLRVGVARKKWAEEEEEEETSKTAKNFVVEVGMDEL